MNENIIAGRNPVIEALSSDLSIDVVYISTGALKHTAINKIRALALEKGLVIKQVDPKKLDMLCPDVNHQGVALTYAVADYYTIDDILAVAEEKQHAPFIVLLDCIEDPHNFGAILRTAEACNVDGIIIPKRHAATLTPTVHKTSAGAASIVKVCKVSNLVATLKELKEKNLFVYGADMGGQPYYDIDYSGGVVLVIGAEGSGLSRLVREQCDFIVSIPMYGKLNSLNASVAAGTIMLHIARL